MATLGAYVWWGLCPLYFVLVAHVAPVEVLIHRVLWSVVLLIGVISLRRQWPETLGCFKQPARLLPLVASSLLISVNWLVFITAVGSGRTLEASFGYFLNPVVTVLLGIIFLGESLNRWQVACLVLASCGVAFQAIMLGAVPWIGLALATSFGFYGLIRKRLDVGSVPGLFVETSLLAVPAVTYACLLGMTGRASFAAGDLGTDLLLASAGVVTTVPLVLFAIGARRVPLTWIGLMQYIVPTLQLLVALLFLRESITQTKLISFALVWAGLALLVIGGLRNRRRGKAAGRLRAGHPS